MVLLLLAIIYLAFISLGLPDSLLGAGWPVMHEYFQVPEQAMGIATIVISGSTIISSLMAERLTKRFGIRLVTLVSITLTAAAMFGFSFAGSFLVLCLWGIPYGLGAGSIDASLNNYVAQHYSSRHMSWLHCFWGVGTIISPYVMSYALVHAQWQSGYRIIGTIQFTIAAVVLLSLPLWRVHAEKDAEEGVNETVIGVRGALRIRGVRTMVLGFLCYCSAEATSMLWIASFLIGTRGVSKEAAAAYAALFCIGITVGRFLSGLISNRFGDRGMIRMGTGIAGVGVVLIALPMLPTSVALAGCIIIGLGCAPVFPCAIHATPDNFGKGNSQAVISVQMASAYVGSTFLPPLFGVLASLTGMWLLPYYVGAFFVAMILLMERTFRVTARVPSAERTSHTNA